MNVLGDLALICTVFLAGGVTSGGAIPRDTDAPAPGLSVREGRLVLNGRPFRGVGANYFSVFSRTLADPADTSYREGLAQLSRAGIPFARFMACGFWPANWRAYLEDRDAYFARLDAVVAAAEAVHVGLIPSLFWNMATVPDIVGEPIDQLGNPNSETIAFIRRYTDEVVGRYRHRAVIWGWEFGNEYNLAADLPNASAHRPPVWPKLKTATARTARDELTSAAMLTAYGEFARRVRRLDARRILITGNAVPRPSAFHNTHGRTWGRDSPEQYEAVLLRDNPDPFDTICVHVYPREKNDYPAGASDLGSLIARLQAVAACAGKPLFVGEFGASRALGAEREQARFGELLTAVETNGVPLAAFWVYDFSGQDTEWNVTPTHARRYMLELVGECNRRLHAVP